MKGSAIKRVNRILLVCTLLTGVAVIWMVVRGLHLILQP